MTNIVLGMRVIIPISVLCGGGTELQTLQLARTLVSSNCSVEVICFNEYYPEVVDMFEEFGVRVVLFENYRKNKLVLLSKLFKVFRKGKPDVVHVQYLEFGLLTLVAAWLARVPIRFATVHQLGENYGWRQKLFMKLSLNFSTAILFVSLAAERSWFGEDNLWFPAKTMSPKKHYTIYNCIDIESIKKANLSPDLMGIEGKHKLANNHVIGIVGRISHQKGHMVLLDALALVKQKISNFKILIIGDCLEKGVFVDKARKLNLDKYIIYTGWLPIWEVYKIYRLIDVIAIPSFQESFGLVAAEAMASGCTVVSTNVGGVPEIINNRVDGILVDPNNPEQLADALVEVLNNNRLSKRLRDSAEVRVSRVFGRENYSLQILSFYQKIMEDNFKTIGCQNLER